MDSGNSGSLQSSSGGGGGGDEEYESRTESISSYLNPPPTTNPFASFSNPNQNPNPMLSSSHQIPSLSHHLPNNTFYDPSTFSHSKLNPNPLYNLDSPWSRNVRSDPSYGDFGVDVNVSQPMLGSQGLTHGSFNSGGSEGVAARATAPPQDHRNNIGVVAKNPKKRTRASRRAPTTVLTTDTTNFRQMVQEFTGIPSAPFSGSAPFSRRLDLFGGGGAVGMGPLYPLRPSAQKIQLPSPFLNSNAAMVDSISTSTNNITTTAPDGNLFPKQTPNLLNLQNPLFGFQSLLQQQQQNQLPIQANASGLGTKPEQGNSSANPLDHSQQVNSTLSGMINSSRRWREGGHDETLAAFEGANGNSQEARGYNMNSSDFQGGEKGLENVVSSSNRVTDHHQGNLDSWICPSD